MARLCAGCSHRKKRLRRKLSTKPRTLPSPPKVRSKRRRTASTSTTDLIIGCRIPQSPPPRAVAHLRAIQETWAAPVLLSPRAPTPADRPACIPDKRSTPGDAEELDSRSPCQCLAQSGNSATHRAATLEPRTDGRCDKPREPSPATRSGPAHSLTVRPFAPSLCSSAVRGSGRPAFGVAG